MSHVTRRNIHAYANRGLDLTIAVTTAEAHTDFTVVTFRAGTLIEKLALTPVDTATGFDVELTLTVADLTIAAGVYRWELVATFGGQVRTVGEGRLTVSEEPTA